MPNCDWPAAPPRALRKGGLLEILRSVEPQSHYYLRLKQALVRYRSIAANGGWPPVPEDRTRRKGDSGAGVGELRKRLWVSGDLDELGELNRPVFDDDLEEAVRRFQRRHKLGVDGIVGRGTAAAMNVPVEVRIDQLRVNLERARWLGREHPDEALVMRQSLRSMSAVSLGTMAE